MRSWLGVIPFLVACSGSLDDGSDTPASATDVTKTLGQAHTLLGPSLSGLPSCTLQANATSYVLGDAVQLTWTASNATTATWHPLSGGQPLPSTAPPTSGTTSIMATVTGDVSITLDVAGARGVGACSAHFTVTPRTQLSMASVQPNGMPAAYSGGASLPYASGSSVNLGSAGPDISANGRYVVFHSGSVDLVPNTQGGRTHIFRRDLLTQTTELVSVDAQGTQNSGYAYDPNISADGRHVCFTYVPAGNDAWGYSNAAGLGEILVKDMVTGALTLVTHAAGDSAAPNTSGSSVYCWMSGDGALVAYTSHATDLVSQTLSDGHSHAFVTRVSDSSTLLADIDDTGAIGNGDVIDVALDGSGCNQVFSTNATNLVAASPGVRQVYVHHYCGASPGLRMVSFNYQANRPFLAGTDRSGTPVGNENEAISDDGNLVIFTSYSPDLVVQSQNAHHSDVFVANLAAQTFTQVSVSSTGAHSLNAMSADPHISRNGRYAVFEGNSENIVPGTTPGSGNSWIHDLQTGETKLLTYNDQGQILALPQSQWGWANGGAPRVANDGTTAFHTLVPLMQSDTNHMWDVYVVKP
jgi:hypothetical protein